MADKGGKNRDKFDPLLHEIADQLGEAMETGLSLTMKQVQGFLSLVVQRMATGVEGATPEKAVLDQSANALKMFSKASTIVPPVASEFTKASTFLVMSTGLKLLRAFNKELRALR